MTGTFRHVDGEQTIVFGDGALTDAADLIGAHPAAIDAAAVVAAQIEVNAGDGGDGAGPA